MASVREIRDRLLLLPNGLAVSEDLAVPYRRVRMVARLFGIQLRGYLHMRITLSQRPESVYKRSWRQGRKKQLSELEIIFASKMPP